jgi:hypothetical protein
MHRRLTTTALVVTLAICAAAWSQAFTSPSGYPRAALQEQGSQQVPQAQPPFSPIADDGIAAPAGYFRRMAPDRAPQHWHWLKG